MVASDISCTPASSAKMPLALDGMPLSKLMLWCTSWAWSMPDANLVAGDERMVKARAPALALMPSWPISTSTPAPGRVELRGANNQRSAEDNGSAHRCTHVDGSIEDD